MTQALAQRDTAELMERAVIQGDLTTLTPAERVSYYRQVCDSLGLNPYTKPFEYLMLDNGSGGKKLVLYARKDCTDQLRDINKVSVTKLEHSRADGLYIVTAYVADREGRTDSAIGAVPIAKEGGYWDEVVDRNGRPVLRDDGKPKKRFVADGTFTTLSGEALANAIMKAETKAKRRATLSLCGLGMTDESELDGIPNARVVPVDATEDEPYQEPAEAAWDTWMQVSAEADVLRIVHKDLADDTPVEKVRRWTAALAEKVETAKKAQRYDEIQADFTGEPTPAEKAAARDETTGEVLDAPPEFAPSPAEQRAALWAENRRLVEEARTRGIHGPTLNTRAGQDVLVTANTELAERIRNYDQDQHAAQQAAL